MCKRFSFVNECAHTIRIHLSLLSLSSFSGISTWFGECVSVYLSPFQVNFMFCRFHFTFVIIVFLLILFYFLFISSMFTLSCYLVSHFICFGRIYLGPISLIFWLFKYTNCCTMKWCVHLTWLACFCCCCSGVAACFFFVQCVLMPI